MTIGKRLFLSFLAVIALNLLSYKFIFENIIVEQIKTDRHEQFKQEMDAAAKVRLNQLLRSYHFKDPVESREISEQLPDDMMYVITIEDGRGNTMYTKESEAYRLKKDSSKKVVSEYHFEHDSTSLGTTIIRFYTDDSDILATKGVTMVVIYIYGSVIIVGLLLIFMLVRWILRPVNELSVLTQDIKAGKREVSFSYKANDEFAALLHSFADMVEQLRISEDRQQELIAAIAHDFRTPLTTIKGYASYIASGRITDIERIRRQMGKIEQKVGDLDELLDELQDYSRLSNELPLTTNRFRLHHFMRQISEEYKTKVRDAGLHFHSKIRVSPELHIEADEFKLRRVLQNLLNNAIYYNKPDGSILLTCDQRDGQVVISVIDKGEGIAEDELPKIFTKFYRAEKSRNRNNGGTGLGLTICQSIIERHQGQITVTSELGRGSCFTVSIPIHQ
ncbi:sensor histidine kinase [Brevibacillus fluminis]|uniref:histidine kinase n=1 Tax=Brevibacillus fluminis TaxID=511487 RepID=A0A3M8DXM4_9BACL|nr:HAMP domain-containing sensor histidine kinase [Brevibacillus fluminis]RNB92295.1 sensor histidine kinase [Brevibacillus fluminis]